MKETKSKIIRHVFRLPIAEGDNVSATIDGATFEVINIALNGIGIFIDREVSFKTDQQFDSIKLNLDGVILYLKGRIVHISPREFQLISGIEFINMSKEDEETILTFLRKYRDTLFT
ncbi:MAG: PilZ domain-containing protein [Desulfobulbaceae bacterium]|nr:PilZ domain-containing protein [Desulfobulbaceae bacterium]